METSSLFVYLIVDNLLRVAEVRTKARRHDRACKRNDHSHIA